MNVREFEKAPIVFHYNKKHNEDSSIPPYVLKIKGETIYVHHINSEVGFTTKETPDNPHTKGSLKFHGRLRIVDDGLKVMGIIH